MGPEIIILIAFLALSGFFSSAETALFSISRSKVKFLAKKGNRFDLLIKKMKETPHRLLSTILIGNNLVNIGASAVATSMAINIFSNNAVGIATGVMTFFILIFGEILPKSIATRNNVAVARIVIYPIYWLSLFFSPVILFLEFIPRITGKISPHPSMTEEELKVIVEVTEEEGEINGEEKELIHNIFKLDDTSASECMTPTTDMFAIDVNKKLPLRAIIKSGFSRIPVYENHIGNIIGIVNIKDIFRHYTTGKGPINIRAIMSKPYFIPESKKLNSLLKQFRMRKHHMAIVINEHGEVLGLITLEDVLEELVGDIIDETDRYEPSIVKLKKNTWLVQGKTHIDEVNEKIPMNIPDSAEYDTISGFLLYKIGRIPVENETISIDNFDITVKRMKTNRIISLLVKKTGEPPEAAGSQE
ncbi:MAG: hypothetical protein B5M56_02805 [Desulfococcus sp. 4484_241]|nr:MAG: hypothetical protein B5M56_02805 [Desulfococcus sp. 4484_241]